MIISVLSSRREPDYAVELSGINEFLDPMTAFGDRKLGMFFFFFYRS